MPSAKTGHCLCGVVSFAYDGPENWMGHCHCESCRRATASGFTSFLGVPNGKWRWTGRKPAEYQSSAGVTRGFCETCGTPMFYRTDRLPDEIHFYAATLDDQTSYQPTTHFFSAEAVPWITLGDDLPKK